jgi:hypothetical protein
MEDSLSPFVHNVEPRLLMQDDRACCRRQRLVVFGYSVLSSLNNYNSSSRSQTILPENNIRL